MKTIALTLFAAALGLAQNQSSTASSTTTATAPAPKAAPKAESSAQNKKPAQSSQRSADQNKPLAEQKKPSAEQKAAAQSQVQTIPPGATLVEPGLYHYTDSNGKTWNYRQTPFGISKWEDTSAPTPQPTPQAKSDPVLVTDLGDSYRFERKTPFGVSTWVRKKSELTDEEKTLTTDQQSQSAPNATTVDSKPAGNL